MTDATARPETIQAADAKQVVSMRGRQAELVINNSAFQDAFKGMRQQIIDKISSAPLNDPKRLELLVMELQQLERLYTNLESFIQAGKAADADIVELQRKFDREQERLHAERNNIYAQGARRLRSAFSARPQ